MKKIISSAAFMLLFCSALFVIPDFALARELLTANADICAVHKLRKSPGEYDSCIAIQADARNEVSAWLKRFGIDPSSVEADIDIEVAARKNESYAVSFIICQIPFAFTNDMVALENCLKREEKIARRMGAPLHPK